MVADILDEFIDARLILREGFVGVDDGKIGSIPADFAGFSVEVPVALGSEEVVVLDFSVEVAWGDVENGWSSVEVEVHSEALIDSGLPGVVISISVEWMDDVAPSLFKALDFLVVLFLAHGDYKILVLDDSAVSEGNFVGSGIDLVDADVIGLSNVLGDDLASGCAEVKLGDAESRETLPALLVEISLGVVVGLGIVVRYVDFVFFSHHCVQMGRKHASKACSNNHHVVLLEVVGRWFSLLPEPERVGVPV